MSETLRVNALDFSQNLTPVRTDLKNGYTCVYLRHYNICLRTPSGEPLAWASSKCKSLFIDVKNMYLHWDSNPGLCNTFPML